ncbi:MAG: acyl-CoA synthetase [Flavobacteriia bacterium]|nr:acyl-CoA synthetase [Flavobacteriia bacterium]
MYLGDIVKNNPNKAAYIMAESGIVVTYAELEANSNQLAHYFRSQSLGFQDHISIFMENNLKYVEACAAAERSGLYYTCINSYLTADEVAYILQNSESELLIVSSAKLDIAKEAISQCPLIKEILVISDSSQSLPNKFKTYQEAISSFPITPIEDELLGTPMLYSSGTTGRPKGVLRPLPKQNPAEGLPIIQFLAGLWNYRKDMVYLSPAPLYHSAPQAAVGLAIRSGATTIIMEKFDPLTYLENVEKYKVTHSQLVPTMFSRMLKLPEDERNKYDLSSLEYAIHAAAPCPEIVKRQMIDWWGPIIYEYYGATEAFGFAACNTQEWLEHPGTVGKIVIGELSVLDDNMEPLPNGEPGTLWFKPASKFAYHNDSDKTKEATSEDGKLTTVGDVGYVDEDGYLYLTDRKAFMIISGGVNIYPQECEDLLIAHPKIFDAAVFGVPNTDLGEEVKAVIQTVEGVDASEDLTVEILEYLSEHLSRQKIPRSIDYKDELPRLPTGKLYKRLLRDEYWGDGKNKIIKE